MKKTTKVPASKTPFFKKEPILYLETAKAQATKAPVFKKPILYLDTTKAPVIKVPFKKKNSDLFENDKRLRF